MKSLKPKNRKVLIVFLIVICTVFLVFINVMWFVFSYAVSPLATTASYYGNGTLADVEPTSKLYSSIGAFSVTITLVSVALGIALKTVKDKWSSIV